MKHTGHVEWCRSIVETKRTCNSSCTCTCNYKYLQVIQCHGTLEALTFLSTVTQKLIWNHSLQHEHWIISVPESSGIRHEQNTAMVFVDLTRFSFRLLRWTGNIVNCPLSKQWMRWCRMALWWNWNLPGGWPQHKAVANAIANTPQSSPPDCIWTSMKWTEIFFSLVASRAAIWCFKADEREQ